MPLTTGTKLGRYEIRAKIGQGGMGEVYLAQDTKLDRKVALKILPAEVAADRNRMSRFVQEAKAASALNHPNIITIYEIEQIDSVNFIATEFIDGETLRERSKNAPMRLGEVLDVAAQIASALSAAHAAGIIHRDIKPENIMLRRDGIVKVLDFGLAKLSERTNTRAVDPEAATKALVQTDPGVVMGTAAYMSPEQARGLTVDARTDIFSLGVVIYEMVAGRAPFGGATKSDLIVALLERDPPPLARFTPEAPAELERLVRKTLAKDREERYQTAKDLLIDLKGLKQKLVVDAEIERSAPPELPAAGGEAKPTDGRVGSTALGAAAETTPASSRPNSSAEYIFSEIKRHKKSAGLTLATLAIVAAAAVFFYFHRATVLTEKDTILIADFVNTTGDPVFDGALKQALSVQLEQSPFLNIFPDERVRETLRYMERSPDERLTRDVAREICERAGLKAMLVGSIAPLGSHYVIALDAVNAHNGDVLAREQVVAESKEQVLSVLGKAATRLREKLGESLSTIQKFDVPIDQATTSSLEALKAYSHGTELGRMRKFSEALPFLKRAVELDPNFAGAYAGLAVTSSNLGENESGKQYITKAFQLRGRASEREKLGIESGYYHFVTGELEKAIEALELLKQTYPRDAIPHVNLGYLNGRLGNYERALEESAEALRLSPTVLNTQLNVAHLLITLGRYDEAREVIQRAQAQQLDHPTEFHWVLYRIAFHQADAAAMQSELEHLRASSGPEAFWFFWCSAFTAEANGQLRKDREMTGQVAELFKQQNQRELAAEETARNAGTDALYSHCELVRKDAASAFAMGRTPESLRRTALAFALCGDLSQAQSLADESARLQPTDTLANTIRLPVIRAAMAIHSGNYAKAIELLEAARRYDRADRFSAHYLRGLAYLGQSSGGQAGAEFQFILDHRGLDTFSPFYPLAQLGLARAVALQGDNEKAHKAYDDFFALWKDADSDLPILIEAKKEYEKLR